MGCGESQSASGTAAFGSDPEHAEKPFVADGTVTNGTTTVPFAAVPFDPPPGSCQILDLTLGPLDLDLLGLVVHLDTVHLNITAQQGPGSLLGNLLCAVTGLLDNARGGNANAITQLIGLISQILGGL